jgi:D-alanyl-D-alanine carboxypeptidase
MPLLSHFGTKCPVKARTEYKQGGMMSGKMSWEVWGTVTKRRGAPETIEPHRVEMTFAEATPYAQNLLNENLKKRNVKMVSVTAVAKANTEFNKIVLVESR